MYLLNNATRFGFYDLEVISSTQGEARFEGRRTTEGAGRTSPPARAHRKPIYQQRNRHGRGGLQGSSPNWTQLQWEECLLKAGAVHCTILCTCTLHSNIIATPCQVGLIVFLAHLGSWVPALKAEVPLTHRLLTRIQTVESISLGMSAFQVMIFLDRIRSDFFPPTVRPGPDQCCPSQL